MNRVRLLLAAAVVEANGLLVSFSFPKVPLRALLFGCSTTKVAMDRQQGSLSSN